MTATIHTLTCEDAIAFVCDSTTPFAEISPTGKFVWLNRAYAEILNAPVDLIVNTHYSNWTHPEDINIDTELASRVLAGEIPGYSLSKRYIQRGSTPQNQRVVWGLLTVSGKWQTTQEFSGFRVQFQPYTQQNDGQPKGKINWQETGKWIVTNWRTLATIVAVSVSLIAGSSATLLEALQKAKETINSVESELQSSPSGALPPPESQ